MTALMVLGEAAASGSGMTLVGIVFGRLTRRNRPPKPPKQICSCNHGRGMHNEQGCHYVRTERVKIRDNSSYTMNQYGDAELSKAEIEWEMVDHPCTCKKYDGPIPAEDYIFNTF